MDHPPYMFFWTRAYYQELSAIENHNEETYCPHIFLPYQSYSRKVLCDSSHWHRSNFFQSLFTAIHGSADECSAHAFFCAARLSSCSHTLMQLQPRSNHCVCVVRATLRGIRLYHSQAPYSRNGNSIAWGIHSWYSRICREGGSPQLKRETNMQKRVRRRSLLIVRRIKKDCRLRT